MNAVSCVSYVSWMYWVNAAETHETFHLESGMRYQVSSSPILSTDWAFRLPPQGCWSPLAARPIQSVEDASDARLVVAPATEPPISSRAFPAVGRPSRQLGCGLVRLPIAVLVHDLPLL